MKMMAYQRKNNGNTVIVINSDTQSETTSNCSFAHYIRAGLAITSVVGTVALVQKTGFLSSFWRDSDVVSGNSLDNPYPLVSSQDVITFADNSLPAQSRHAKRAFGSEFQINTYTTSDQSYPSVADLSTGDFAVVWQSNGQDGNYTGIYGQRYSSTGVPQGSEFQINTYTTLEQEFPSVAGLSTSDFAVVWQSNGQDRNGSWGVYGQRFSNTGIPQGGEFQVNTYTTEDQMRPSVAALDTGDFVVVWNSNGQDGYSRGIYGQRFSSTGAPQGSEFQVHTYTTMGQYYPSVAALSTGGFVVTWMSNGQDGFWDGIYGQRYSSTGVPQGSEFQINTYTTNSQEYPSIAGLSTGDFVVVWNSNGQDGSSYGIYGQRYSSTGVPQDSEFQINTYSTSSQKRPSVAGINTDGFVVVWESLGQDRNGSWGVYGQRFSSTGIKQGGEFQINTYTVGGQHIPSVTGLTTGDFVVTWESDGQDGDVNGIYGRIYFTPVLINNGLTVLSVSELFNIDIGTTNTTALSFDTIEITQVDPSLTINWNDTKALVDTVTIPDITSGRKVAITSDGTNANPTITTKTCKDGVCSEEKTTTLATAFSLGSANDEQTPKWWMWVVGSISAGIIIVAGVGGTVCVCKHRQSETAQNRHNARKKHDAIVENLKIKDEGDLHGPRFFQPPTSKGTTGVLSIDNQPEIQPAQALTP